MNTETPSAKCRCRNCNGHIEFDQRSAGQNVTCPHCGMDTQLYIPGHARIPIEHGKVVPAKSRHSPAQIIALVAGVVIVLLLACLLTMSDVAQAIGGGIVSLVLVVVGFVVVCLWIAFPVFVYFAIGRFEKLLQQIERNTRRE